MFQAAFISGENRGLKKDTYFHKVASILAKHLKPMLIIAPCKEKRGFIKVKPYLWYYCLPSFFHMLLLSLSKIRIPANFLVSQDPFWYGLMARVLRKKDQLWIVEVHSEFFYNAKWFYQRKRNIIYHALGLWNLKHADYFRIVYHDKKLQKLFPKKMLFIPSNYTDISLFKDKGLTRTIDVLFIGRLHPEKNIEYLIKILTSLKHQGYKVKIIGKANKSKYLQKINNAKIPYLQHTAQPQKEYAKTKIVIIVSHNEGGPRVAYEALASGCLVATTPVGKIKEDLIQHEECGTFLTGKDVEEDVERIKQLLKEYDKKWQKCYKKIRRKLNFEKQVETYAKTYARLLRQSS